MSDTIITMRITARDIVKAVAVAVIQLDDAVDHSQPFIIQRVYSTTTDGVESVAVDYIDEFGEVADTASAPGSLLDVLFRAAGDKEIVV